MPLRACKAQNRQNPLTYRLFFRYGCELRHIDRPDEVSLYMPRATTIIPPLLLAALVGVLFILLYTGPLADGDCFWHLASGRWIAQHRALPGSDFLTFTVTDHNPFRPASQRIPFLLSQYWLGQLGLYGAWQLGGAAGIVLLRALVYGGILTGLFCWMRRDNRGCLPLVFTTLIGLQLRAISNERPQLFSFAFMPLVLFLLDRAATPTAARKGALLGLPLVMLLWANTHGAYILGCVLCGIYLATHLATCAWQRRRPDLPFVAAATFAMVITLLNPGGTLAWTEISQALPAYIASIYENLSPWYVAVQLQQWYPVYWLYLAACLAGAVWFWRRMAPAHLLTLAALGILSLTALRYLAFPFLAAPLLVRYLPEISWNRTRQALYIAILAGWLGFTWRSDLFAFRAQQTFPVKAAAFLQQNRPAPQLFNYYDWGGYLAWTVPGLKVFIDGRGLVEELSLEHDQVMAGNGGQALFDRYGISTVIIPGLAETTGEPLPLAEQLAAANDWRLVYFDDTALIFVRLVPANRDLIARHPLAPNGVQQQQVLAATRLLAESPDRALLWLTKANALQLLGDRPAAMQAYRQVLRLDPANDWARRMLAAGGEPTP